MADLPPSPEQIRAAVGLLGWDYKKLAQVADITVDTISRVCLGKHTATPRIREKMRKAFETHGVEFLEGNGVRQRYSDIEVFEGPERFQEFTEFVYAYLKEKGGEVCISTADETLFARHRRNLDRYLERMIELCSRGDVTVRIVANKSSFRSPFAKMRWLSIQKMTPTAFYAFGNNLALISFDHTPAPYVVLHKSGPFAEAYKHAFEISWEAAKDPSERPKS